MAVLDFAKKDGGFSLATDLNGLLDHAASLGRVTLEQPIFDTGKWECQISFRRASGSRVSAKGEDQSRDEAVRRAINEAVELGARP